MSGVLHERFTLTILSGQANSEVYDLRSPKARQLLQAIHFYSPATLPEDINIQVSYNAGTTWDILRSAGVDIVLDPSRADVIDVEPSWDQLRLSTTTSTVAGNRVFNVRTVAGE